MSSSLAALSGLKLNTLDRKSTRLNSSHDQISYAVFCLKKKKKLQLKGTRRARSQSSGLETDQVESRVGEGPADRGPDDSLPVPTGLTSERRDEIQKRSGQYCA